MMTVEFDETLSPVAQKSSQRQLKLILSSNISINSVDKRFKLSQYKQLFSSHAAPFGTYSNDSLEITVNFSRYLNDNSGSEKCQQTTDSIYCRAQSEHLSGPALTR